jgi:tRNA pseudouridine55 synthase
MSIYNTQKIVIGQGQNGIFSIYKKTGETLAVLVKRLRTEQSFREDLPITYAGRLDPMAEGLVLLLTGEDCKRKDEFLGLDKTYKFEVLFGVTTDTLDMLGIVTETEKYLPTEEEIKQYLEIIKNTREFSYPAFSSKPVEGLPLFVHAKNGSLPKEMPTIKGEIKNISLKSIKDTNFKKAVEEKMEIIKNVQGDFRQKQILNSWQEFLKNFGDSK